MHHAPCFVSRMEREPLEVSRRLPFNRFLSYRKIRTESLDLVLLLSFVCLHFGNDARCGGGLYRRDNDAEVPHIQVPNHLSFGREAYRSEDGRRTDQDVKACASNVFCFKGR